MIARAQMSEHQRSYAVTRGVYELLHGFESFVRGHKALAHGSNPCDDYVCYDALNAFDTAWVNISAMDLGQHEGAGLSGWYAAIRALAGYEDSCGWRLDGYPSRGTECFVAWVDGHKAVHWTRATRAHCAWLGSSGFDSPSGKVLAWRPVNP